MKIATPSLQCRKHLVERNETVVDDVGDFVEDHQVVALVQQPRPRDLPRGSGCFSIAIQIEALPGESMSHRQPRQIRRLLADLPFTGSPLALDELDHADAHAMAKRAKGSADRRSGLSLAVAGI